MTDDLDTIDGAVPREATREATPTPRPSPFPTPVDYSELLPVDRRHYSINGEIAKGGMGRVLDARDLRLGRAVAIKELLPKNRDLAQRFEREARITARLQHPAIIHVYEAGVWIGGEPFYAMPKVSGRSLYDVIADKATLNERLGLLPNVIAIADALAYAHDAGVIHRDLKPANVLVGEFGQTVVIDWGLAKDLSASEEPGASASMRIPTLSADTNVGSVVGTPAYMPPEQARGKSVDQRADVYALGALLYTVLVGKPPYAGKPNVVLERVKTEPPTPIRELEPGAPLDLAAIVAKAMAREPDDRYADAGELAQDLRRFETGQLVAAHHYTTRQLTWRWVRRRRLALGIALVAVIALAIMGSFSLSRIVDYTRKLATSQSALHEDRGRNDLLAGRVGQALVNLASAAGSRDVGATSLGFMMAEAARSFDAQVFSMGVGKPGRVVVAYSPDGTLVAAAGEGAIFLWDGTRTLAFGHKVGRTRAIAFDPKGNHILTAGDDGFLRMWSRDGLLLREVKAHAGPILDATFSSDGRYVATASADGSARVWDLDAPNASTLPDDVAGARPWSCGGAEVVSIRFSPDGKRVAAAVGSTGCVWEQPSAGWGHGDGTFVSPLLAHTAAINTIRWSLDGSRIATASADGTARVWLKPAEKIPDAGAVKPTMAPIGREGGPGIASAEWSADGAQLLVADADHLARLVSVPETDNLSAKAGREIRFEGHTAGLSTAVFSPDGNMIATAGLDSSAKLWDAATGTTILSLEPGGAVETLVFSPNGRYLVTGSRDGNARVWDLSKRADRESRTFDSPVHAVAVSPTADRTVAIGRDDSYVTVLHGDKEVKLANGLGRVTATAWSRDGSLLVTAGDGGTVTVWTAALRRLFELPHERAVRSVAFSRDGASIATASDDGYVRLWNASDGRRLQTFAGQGNKLSDVAFCSSSLIAALDDKGELILWGWAPSDPPRDRARPPLEHLRVTTAAAVALAFSHDGRRIAVSSPTDTVIREVDGFVIGRRIIGLEPPTGDVRAVVFSVDDSRVFTAGGDGKVRIWDAEDGKLIWTRDAPGVVLESLAISKDGNMLWAGGGADNKGIVRAWDIRSDLGYIELLRALGSDPWELGEDDLVKLKNPGDSNDQR